MGNRERGKIKIESWGRAVLEAKAGELSWRCAGGIQRYGDGNRRAQESREE